MVSEDVVSAQLTISSSSAKGTFSGNFSFATGADVQSFAASFDEANALAWTNPRDGFTFTYDPGTQTGTATFFDGVSTHFLVAAHTFLELVHYGAWIVLIPLWHGSVISPRT